jgi:ABC-type uncharacterized transport system YnjBCD ATPase subunit
MTDGVDVNKETGLVLEALRKRFGEHEVLKEVSLEVRPGEFFTLLGPSGCGKTTLLRIVGGFEVPDGGRAVLKGQDLTPLPAHRRPVNTVFQNHTLFLAVYDPLKGALAAGRPLMGRGIPLERAFFHYTRPEVSALPPARLWPGERADLVVFDRDPLEHPEEARVVRVEVDGVAVFTA